MREGDWVLLDEINLAPAEVLESFNCILDDRGFLVVESGSVIPPLTPIFILRKEMNKISSLKCTILVEKLEYKGYVPRNMDTVEKHPNFRLFAAMNPSTDVGKRDLPVGIKNRWDSCLILIIVLREVYECILYKFAHHD